MLSGLVLPQKLRPNLMYPLGGNGHLFSRIQELKQIDSVDVLFLGSSHAYRGFDTRIFADSSISVFNLGSSAQTPLQTNILLKRYLDKIKVQHIIYEVYPGTLCSDGVEASLDLLANDGFDFMNFDLLINTKHLKVLNTFIYAAFRKYFRLDDDFKEPKEKYDDLYVKGGFVEKKAKAYHPPKTRATNTFKHKANQVKYFKENIALIKSQDIKFTLVIAPVTSSLYSSYTNHDFFEELFAKQGTLLNYNPKFLDDSLDFYDAHHLNQRGVERFNRVLIRDFKKD